MGRPIADLKNMPIVIVAYGEESHLFFDGVYFGNHISNISFKYEKNRTPELNVVFNDVPEVESRCPEKCIEVLHEQMQAILAKNRREV